MGVNESLGDVKIQNDVVANIASVAMAEVEGVVTKTGNRLLDPLFSHKGAERGVTVEIEENRARLTLEVRVVFGNVIYDTAKRLQQRVKNSVEQMTGLIVEAVDVNVLGIESAPKVEDKEDGQ